MSKPDVRYTVYNLKEHPNKFLLVRLVGDYATHFLDPEGVWVALPEDDQDLMDMFEYLKETGALPEWETTDDK